MHSSWEEGLVTIINLYFLFIQCFCLSHSPCGNHALFWNWYGTTYKLSWHLDRMSFFRSWTDDKEKGFSGGLTVLAGEQMFRDADLAVLGLRRKSSYVFFNNLFLCGVFHVQISACERLHSSPCGMIQLSPAISRNSFLWSKLDSTDRWPESHFEHEN